LNDLDEADELFVGGEFYYNERWQVENPADPSGGALFLNGGKASLIVICDYLKDHGIRHVLLPSYLCPTILDTLEACGLAYDFYAVERNFSIDRRSLTGQLAESQAVYFINYFGFQPGPDVLTFLSGLRQQGRLLIEDNAQAGFAPRSIGDFVFNSMRKLCPYDGGYLRTAFDLQPYLEAYRGFENQRLPIIRQYRAKLHDYLLADEGDFEELDSLYAQAEAFYVSDLVVLGDDGERQQIERLDWPAIRSARRQNYHDLLQLITPNTLISPIFPNLQPGIMPLGLPVYVRDGLRDALNDYLGGQGIGLTIHWEDLATDLRLQVQPEAVRMARKILTLTVDQYTDAAQLRYLAQCLADFEQSTRR
jgi:hypothetical protein